MECLAAWEEQKPVVRELREAARKSKASLEITLARVVKDNRNCFFKYTADKTNSRGNVGPLMNEVGARVTEDAENVEFLNASLVSVCFIRGPPERSSFSPKVVQRSLDLHCSEMSNYYKAWNANLSES